MLTESEKNKIKQIHDLFNNAEDIFLSLPNETRDKITDFHNESGSLPYCIRWGLIAADELIRFKG
ncbi:hypothetical protein AAAC51_06325 [Priestia megaterium]